MAQTTREHEAERERETAAQATAAQAAGAPQRPENLTPYGTVADGPPLTPEQMAQTGTGTGPGGFQKTVTTQPAPAVAGDYCDANPRHSVDIGPGGFVAGTSGLYIGRFAWWDTAGPLDANGMYIRLNNTGAGSPNGFIHRDQQGLILIYLQYAGMQVPAGFGVTMMATGGYWALNNSGANMTAANIGNKVFVKTADGTVGGFAAAGGTVAGCTESAFTAMSVAGTNELFKMVSRAGAPAGPIYS